jgi:dienelactone hydrolase
MKIWRWILVPLMALPLVATTTAAAAAEDVVATEVSFEGSGGVVLHGTVVAPAAQGERRAAMVMVQGAGNRGRRVIRPDADAFARLGVVVLIYDKRTEGYSLLHRDYSVLADDALAGLRLLSARPDVDPQRLGLWAASEGAFAAPLAARRSDAVRFVIAVGAAGVEPAVQTRWQWSEYLRHGGVSGSLAYTMRETAFRTVVAAGLFTESGFDAAGAWTGVRQPVLAEWGELDHDVMPAVSAPLIRRALARGGNTGVTIRTVPGVRHSLHLTANGGFDHLDALPADYGRYEAAWIAGLPNVPGAGVQEPADREPEVPAIAPLPWYGTPWLQLAGFTLLVAGFAAYPVTAAVRRLRGRRYCPPVRRPARWLAGAGLAATLGAPLYLLFMMASAANVIGPVALGRPLPWLALQLLAVATVVAAAATATAGWRRRRDVPRAERVRLGLLVAAGGLFLPLAVYWGLLLP